MAWRIVDRRFSTVNGCVQGFVGCRESAARKDLDSYYLFHISTLVHSGEIPTTDAVWRGSEAAIRALQELDVVELFFPPLIQRADEIPALTSFFLDRLNRRYKCDVRLCSDVIREFQTRRWPGNVTELAAALHEVFMVQGQSLGNTIPTPS